MAVSQNVHTYTFGCRVNYADTMALEAQLGQVPNLHIDHEKADSPDMILINTCTVTEQADKQAMQLVRKLNRQHPDTKIVLTGCYAELEKKALATHRDIDRVLDFKDQKHMLSLLGLADSKVLPQHTVPLAKTTRTRANLKIQDGCQAYCSYCVLPYVRGKSRSVPLDIVLKQADAFVEHGHQEVVITGTHIAGYGRDFTDRKRLSDVLYGIYKRHPKLNIRVSSLEPVGLTPDFIKAAESIPSICRHFHIPLQSGSDKVLKLMNRKYQTRHYQARIQKLASTREDINIGSDVIVGYPGETQADFEETCMFVASMPLSYLHVFPYSPRPNTKAATFKETVNPSEKKQRVRQLIDIGIKKKKAFYTSQVGKTCAVLIENKRTQDGFLKSVSSNYLNVRIQGHDRLMRSKVDVALNKVCEDHKGDVYIQGRVL